MQPALIFEPEPVPRLPGPAVGPKGPKIGQNPGPDLSFYPTQGLPGVHSGDGSTRTPAARAPTTVCPMTAYCTRNGHVKTQAAQLTCCWANLG